MRDYASPLSRRILGRWKLWVGILVLGAVITTGTLVHLAGLAAYERHHGYFAPIWSEDGKHIYLLERRTTGIIWGMGWEHFTPPAYSYVLSDRVSLARLDPDSGALTVLENFDGSPVQGRVTRHYRGRIFNYMGARILPESGAIDFRIRMDIHKVPRSEPWALAGVWRQGQASNARWVNKGAGNTGSGNGVLRNGIELMTVKGREAFPAAVIAIKADGSHRVLIKNSDFDALHPNGVPRRWISERSRQKSIDGIRNRGRVRAELMAKYQARGMNEAAASIKTYDEMEARGLYPKRPRLVAKLIAAAPDGVRIFDIPQQRFKVGIFQDIAHATAMPGVEVLTSTGDYLKYADDATGLKLKSWRRAGNDRFAVRTGGKLYLLEVRRFNR
jgi:hypothetical protein